MGEKRTRYPLAVNLVPFILETGGRMGMAARNFARRLAPVGPNRNVALQELWQDVATELQKQNALMVLRSQGT